MYPHSNIKQLILSFDKYNAVYFRIPKVASTSLVMMFRQIDNVEEVTEYDSDDYKFTFVRNPFDRLASCFRHVIQKGAMVNIQDDTRLYREMLFSEFVDVISQIEIKDMDIHFRPQYTFIPEKPDYIGKFENLKSDYFNICEAIGIKNPPTLQHQNKTFQTTFKDYYNPEIIKKVVKIYAKDFELFGYEKTLYI